MIFQLRWQPVAEGLGIFYLAMESYILLERVIYQEYLIKQQSGTQGQIGNGNTVYKVKSLEKVIGFDNKIKFITSGRSHSIAIDEMNECYSWGCGKYGKLGHQDQVDQLKPKRINHFMAGKKSSRQLRNYDQDEEGNSMDEKDKQRVAFSSQITYGSCSKSCSFMIQKGKVWTVGRNHYGMLGYQVLYNQPFIQELKQIISLGLQKIHIEGISAGQNHCLAWTQNGKLYSWGKYGDGCLGYMDKTIGGNYIQSEPKLIEGLLQFDISNAVAGNKHSLALTNCGKVFQWGKGVRDMRSSLTDFFEPQNAFDQSRFKGLDLFFTSISSGSTHSAAVTSSGTLYMWGESTDGCLGRPPPESNPKQISLMPLEVDFFGDKRVTNLLFILSQVHQVACGEKFTLAITLDRRDQMLLAKKNQEEQKTHISTALKKKLLRRVSFKQIKIHFKVIYSRVRHEYTVQNKRNSSRRDVMTAMTSRQQLPQNEFVEKFTDCFSQYLNKNNDLVEQIRQSRAKTPFSNTSRFERSSNPLSLPLENQSQRTRQYFDQLLGSTSKSQLKDKKRESDSTSQRDDIFYKQPSKLLQRRIKNKQILLSESLNFNNKDSNKELAQMFNFKPQTTSSLSKTQSGKAQIKDLIQNLYESNQETIYDDVNENIAKKYNENSLQQTNFYYYNIIQNREEFNQELKFQKQKEVAQQHSLTKASKIFNQLATNGQIPIPQDDISPEKSGKVKSARTMPAQFSNRRKSADLNSQFDFKNINPGTLTQRNNTMYNNPMSRSQNFRSQFQRYNQQQNPNIANKERINQLIKMKEDIEMQSLSLKKIMMMNKLEEVNKRKENILIRKKAEAVKQSICRYGFKRTIEDAQEFKQEIDDNVKYEMLKIQREIVAKWLKIIMTNEIIKQLNNEFRKRVEIKYKNRRKR
ncbi:regulator of chromosome condensation [Stylonychia lemnae]|uniref:Regulator of chromosome condensation n=1 Tax=Stylonychia lemnae TaxID=5949 RepID=A0A077ZP15_STYLE|nr:regulator of chromosome condensation [Stylonychia lemnae]|eukprot:CDW71707.1 regulator of chromosome condensation [Stylonychia lemnae]